MGEMIKMVVVLTILSVISGGGLKGLEEWAKPKIENNVMNLVKGPAIRGILEAADNDPVEDRFKITDGDQERNIFVGVFGGTADTVVVEASANGYGDKVGYGGSDQHGGGNPARHRCHHPQRDSGSGR
jgi:electron transport complex protein RnfG